jgi:hypothetical protein
LIQGTISLPANKEIPSRLSLSDDSFKSLKKKVIGGLLQSTIDGSFIHTNTIEEYQAFDV